ncbi:MAG: signal peptidase I [Stellaceae bacterium]
MPKKRAGGLAETVKTLVYAIIIALVIRSFLYEPFNIPSASMEPTLRVGDYLFVSKFSYGYSRYSLPFALPLFKGRIFFHEPKMGDVAVFRLPANPSIDYIKRIIGLPGDTIQMKAGRLYINGKEVPRRLTDGCRMPGNPNDAAYQHYIETLPDGVQHCILELGDNRAFDNTPVFHVPPGHFFMMGDNRDDSADSRDPMSGVGYVPAANLVGKAQFLFFSTNGYADWWQVWAWPFTIRYARLFSGIH